MRTNDKILAIPLLAVILFFPISCRFIPTVPNQIIETRNNNIYTIEESTKIYIEQIKCEFLTLENGKSLDSLKNNDVDKISNFVHDRSKDILSKKSYKILSVPSIGSFSLIIQLRVFVGTKSLSRTVLIGELVDVNKNKIIWNNSVLLRKYPNPKDEDFEKAIISLYSNIN